VRISVEKGTTTTTTPVPDTTTPTTTPRQTPTTAASSNLAKEVVSRSTYNPAAHHQHEMLDVHRLPPTEDDVRLAQRFAVHRIQGKAANFQPFEFLVEPKACVSKCVILLDIKYKPTSIDEMKKRIIVYVMVGPILEQYNFRQAIRREWADDAKNRSIEVTGPISISLFVPESGRLQVVFVMGRVQAFVNNNDTLDVAATRFENEQFGDVLMFNMKDRFVLLVISGLYCFSWEHLIHKWWATAHYHSTHCSHITQMVYADSDTVIFPENFELVGT
jgi:hypothetical protein